MNSPYSPAAQLGPYELLLPMSENGAAQTWVARLVGTGGFRAHVALKAIPRACFDDMPTEHLLLEQAALAALVRHPNLAHVLDLGEQDDTLYVATEWVDGESLRTVLAAGADRGAMPLPIAVNLVGQLCRGLQAIHELRNADGAPANAVHGHVSPQNLLLSYNGTVKLSDFGIARVMDRLSFLSGPDEHNHKLTFAAPEQLSGGLIDRRSDVFGVGTLLYLLTTGRHPFQGGDVRATLHNICSSEAAPPVHSVVEDYPEELANVVAKALQKSCDARYQSATELIDALEAAMPGCFHSSCDQALASYVDGLCSARRLELQSRIHAAEMRHNRIRASLPAGRPSVLAGRPSLHGSLRAVSIDQGDGASFSERSASVRAAALRASTFYKANSRRLAPVALGSTAALLVCVGLWRGLGAHAAPQSPQHAARVDPVATLPELSVRSLPVQTKGPAHEAAPPQTAEREPEASENGAPSSAHTSAGIPITPLASLPVAPRTAPGRSFAPRASVAAKGIAAPSASATAQPASASASATANPWDPDTFGGRH